MNDICALLKTAARRLELTSFIDKLHWVAIVVAIIALGLMIADRLPAQAFVPWVWVGPVLGGIAGVAALVWWSQRRPSQQHVAVVVDERLDLREKLSTALSVRGRNDAFAQAAIEDAVTVARDKRTHELVGRRFQVQPPRMWFISPLIILAAIMISFLSPLDVFRKDQQQAEVKQAKLEAEKAIDVMVKAIKESPLLEKELADALAEASKEGTDPNAPFKKPEDAKRDALKKATDIQKKLDELVNGEKAKTAEAIEKALSQLEKPQEDGDAKELADALAKGDFQRAQQAIKNLQDKAEKGQLNEEDKKAAAEALEKIAEQLNQMAQQQEQMKEALQQAGLDPNLANNPQALQQALQKSQNLNQQQKQDLQKMAQAQQAAAQMCQGLAGACQNMAAGLNGQGGKMGEGAAQAGAQLGDLEALQQLLQEAKAAQGQCQGMCQGLGQGLAMTQGQGMGMGNRGQGRGGKAPIAPTPTGNKEQKADVNTVEGDIIAKQLFEGQQIRGDSKAQLIKVIENERKGFDEGLTEDQVHRKYQEAQKHYFGELEKLTKAMKEDAKASSSSSGSTSGDKPKDDGAEKADEGQAPKSGE